MADVPSPVLTLNEIKNIHKTDRDLYSFLTISLCRNPVESMRVMALWLWFELFGFSNVVKSILSLPYSTINGLADEAIAYIKYLSNFNPLNPPTQPIDLPLTRNQLLNNDMNFLFRNQLLNNDMNFLFRNQSTTIKGIRKILNEVCQSALGDLMQQARDRNAAQIAMSSFSVSSVSPFIAKNRVPPKDRTIFATFSKGHPVQEHEICEFFNMVYGDCMESIVMEPVPVGKQSLNARVVFYTPDMIDAVLNGKELAKIKINGKHVWMRKFT